MPRQRPGLGQGLSALVAPARPEPSPMPAAAAGPAWEYAAIVRKRRRILVELANGDPVRGFSRHLVRGMPIVALLGLLGAAGWELVAIEDRRMFLKRPVSRQ
ncbi:MAG: hypothetical protein WHT63_06405 [Tepidiforma sp.]